MTRLFFIFVTVLLSARLSAQVAYKLGQIPPLAVGENKSLNVIISDIPNGETLSLVSIREDLKDKIDQSLKILDNHLIYNQSESDYFTFLVGLKHASKIDTIQITPYYDKSSEYEFIQNAGIQPNSNSSYYIEINDITDRTEKLWNHKMVKTRKIDISGKNITVDLSNDNNVLKTIKQNSADTICDNDIESISFYCDTLTLKTKLWLPQTEVKIYCKVLVFDKVPSVDITVKNVGYINTTPIDFPTGRRADEYGINGDNGSDAGNIFVNSSIIKCEADDETLFVANGGNGQNGGPGNVGDNKSAIPIGETFSDMRGMFRLWPNCFDQNQVGNVIYSERLGLSMGNLGQTIIRGSKRTFVQKGGDAKPPGFGGQGGKAGEIHIVSSHKIDKKCINFPGKEGLVFGCNNNCVVYQGGAGQVANWILLTGPGNHWKEGGFFDNREITVQKTYDVVSRNGQQGDPFPPAPPSNFKSWVHFKFFKDSINSILSLNKISFEDGLCKIDMKDIDNDGYYDSFFVSKRITPNSVQNCVNIGSFKFDDTYIQRYSSIEQNKFYYQYVYQKEHFDSVYNQYGFPKLGALFFNYDSTCKWLSSLYVEKEIQYIKDVYLSGNLERTFTNLNQLQEFIASALKDTTNRFYVELSAKYAVVNSLLNRVASNLDYFGNPAGYCPLLSLWVNKKLFENSIDQSISNIILCRKILSAQKNIYNQQANFGILLSQLSSQLQAAYSNYDLYNVTLNQLLSDASVIENQIQVLQTKIKLKEEDLLRIAQSEVEKAHEVPFLKKAAGILATACKVIPVYQPVLGAIGQGLDFVSNINTDDPLQTIQNIPDFYSVLNEKGFSDSKKNFESKLSEFKRGDKSILQYGKDLYKTYNNEYAPAIQKIIQAAKDSKVDAKEIYAKLEEIKTSFPDYAELANELKELTDKKVDFNRQIADFTNKISSTDALVSEKLIQAAKLELAVRDLNTSGIPPETVNIISSIEKTEFERLLEYQYYLAKSYEYRMLEPYPNKLSFEHEFNSLIKIVDSTQTILNENDRIAAIKLIYKNATQNVIDRFVYKLQNEKFVHIRTPLLVSLNSSQLNQLNSQGATTVDLSQSYNLLGLDNSQANRIIYSIQLKNPTFVLPNEKGNVVTSISINNNEGTTSYNGRRYKFLMGNGFKPLFNIVVNTNPDIPTTPITNEEKYDISEFLEITGLQPSDIADIKSFQSIFTHPLLETKILIQDKSAVQVTYQSLIFEVDYGYIPQNGLDYLLLVNVGSEKHKVVVENMNTGIKTFFMDKFEYIFKDGDKIKISAEPFYGKRIFDHWEDHRGRNVSNASSYILKRNDYTILKPIYK